LTFSLDDLRRAVAALPDGSSLTLPRELLAQALGDSDAPPADEMLTPDQAAKLLRTHKRWVYRHADDLGAVHLTRRKLRFKRSALDRFIKRKQR